MTNQKSKLSLLPFDIDGVSSIQSIKLIETVEGVYLASSETVPDGGIFKYKTIISLTPINDKIKGDSTLFIIPQLLPPPPKWDIVCDIIGSFFVVHEVSQGALTSLSLKSTKNDDTAVTAKYRLESFNKPRFVKQSIELKRSLSLSAIDENEHLVIFETLATGDYGAYRQLCDCEDGVVIKTKNGLNVFCKSRIYGEMRGNDIPPGNISFIRISADYKPMGSAIKILDGTTVFEFDVDFIGDKIVILATTQDGAILLIGRPDTGSLEVLLCKSQNDGLILTTPSILVTKSHLHIAAIELAKTDKAKLMMVSYKIDSLLDN